MKYKLKFRVSTPADPEGKNSKKYSVNVEEGQSFTLGKYIPGVDHPIACLATRGGRVHASPKGDLEDLDLNGARGREFTLKANDILKSGGYTIEFLEVPYTPEPVRNETQFLDISGINSNTPHQEATQVGAFETPEPQASVSEAPVVETPAFEAPAFELPAAAAAAATPSAESSAFDTTFPHQEATRVGALKAPAEEVAHETKTTVTPRQSTTERHEEATMVRSRAEAHEQAQAPAQAQAHPREEQKPQRDRRTAEDHRFNVRRPSPVAMEITAMLPRKVQDLSQDRFQIVASIMMLLIASGMTTSIGGFGKPLIGGAAGTAGLAMIAYLLHSFKHITTANGDFPTHLRFIAIASFGLVPWAFAYKSSPIGSMVVALMLCGGIYFGLTSYLKSESKKAWSVAGALAALPILAALAAPGFLRKAPVQNQDNPEMAATQNPPITENPVAAPSPNQAVAINTAPQATTTPETAPPQGQVQAQPPMEQRAPAAEASSAPAPVAAPVAIAPNVAPPAVTQPRNEVPDPLGAEELFTAIRAGNVEIVRNLVLTGAADPNFNLERGSTPLMVASQMGRESIVRFLLTRKVAVDAKDPSGTTALMWAVLKDRYSIAKLLLANGANPNISRDNGQTALDIARRWNNRMMISLLQGERLDRSLAETRHRKNRRTGRSSRSSRSTHSRSSKKPQKASKKSR